MRARQASCWISSLVTNTALHLAMVGLTGALFVLPSVGLAENTKEPPSQPAVNSTVDSATPTAAPSEKPLPTTPQPETPSESATNGVNAQDPASSSAARVAAIPVVQKIIGETGKLFPLGERSGLDGWLAVKDGRLQFLYTTPDEKTVIIGAVFSGSGESITGLQLNTLIRQNPEIAQMIGQATRQQAEVVRAGGAGGFTSIPSVLQQNTDDNTTPQGVPLSPGERLIADLNSAAGVVLGRNDSAEVLMVVDVDCPFCRQAWQQLRDPVRQGKLQVRLIPTSNTIVGDSLRAGARLLEVDNPLDAWDSHTNGNKASLAGRPDDLRRQAVLSNRLLLDRWGIKSTPYLVYRSKKDGKVKIVQGRPDRMAAVLVDVVS